MALRGREAGAQKFLVIGVGCGCACASARAKRLADRSGVDNRKEARKRPTACAKWRFEEPRTALTDGDMPLPAGRVVARERKRSGPRLEGTDVVSSALVRAMLRGVITDELCGR
jgi:hypothetical protein